MTGKLAHVVGVLIGDGYVSRSIIRRSHGAGFHWKVVVTGPYSYVLKLQGIFFDVFRISGGIKQDKRKRDSWQLRFSNLILHRFLARVIELPMGRKTTHRRWSRFDLVKKYPLQFLSGLIDSDGHVGQHYLGIIQANKNFLRSVQVFAKGTLGVEFRGPYVNKKQVGKITSWIISIFKRDERSKLIRGINSLHLGLEYKDVL